METAELQLRLTNGGPTAGSGVQGDVLRMLRSRISATRELNAEGDRSWVWLHLMWWRSVPERPENII